jgi:hypothetical protein
VSRWHGMDEAEKEHWNALAERSKKKRTTGFNLFLSAGMKEFEEILRVLEIKTSVRSSRRFVRVKARSTCDVEWQALLLHAYVISFAFRYKRE